jgi:hypothetical protein
VHKERNSIMGYHVFSHGHDFGNSETCGVLLAPNQHIERRVPSVSAIGSWRRVVAAAKGMGQEEVQLQANHYVLEYDTEENGEARRVEKIIGQKVFDDGATPLQTIGDSSRYWVNNYNLEMLMVSTGSILMHYPEYGVHVVTGLPISVYLDDPANAELVRDALLGVHRYYLNGAERIMHVESVKVIMEGAGALIAYGTTEPVLQGVIDIGGLTTDLFAATGQKPRTSMCKGFPLGVAAANERLAEKFREHYGFTPSLEARADLLKQHVTRVPYRVVNDRKYNRIPDDMLKSMVESSLREIGQEIAQQVVMAWDRDLQEFRQVQIVGGGAHYFAPYIRERIAMAKAAPRPEMANAEGYARLAEAAYRRAAAAAANQRAEQR